MPKVRRLQAKATWLVPMALAAAYMALSRYATATEIEWGGDAVLKWFHAKQITHGVPIDHWTHHTSRLAIVVPAALAALVFGVDPLVYYLPTQLVSILLAIAFYVFARRLENAPFALLGSLILAAFPQMARNGSQLLPGAYCALYVLLGTFILLYRAFPGEGDATRTGERWIVLAAVAFFASYLSWIGNLFFLPGVVLGIWLHQRRLRPVVLFCAPLLALYLAETAAYWIFLGEPRGQLGVIAANHLGSERLQPVTFPGLFDRLLKLREWWMIFTWPAMGYAAWAAGRSRSWRHRLISLALLSFLGLLTFSVKSLDPLVPAVLFHSRYLTSALPFVIILGMKGYAALVGRVPWRPAFTYALAGVLAAGAAVSTWKLPNPVYDETRAHEVRLNRAWDSGQPILAEPDPDGWKLIEYTFMRLHKRDWFDTATRLTRLPQRKEAAIGGRTFQYAVKEGVRRGACTGAVLLAMRPLRVVDFPEGCAVLEP